MWRVIMLRDCFQDVLDVFTQCTDVLPAGRQCACMFTSSRRRAQIQILNLCMQGNCTGPTPTLESLDLPGTQTPLRPFLPRQCLMLARQDFPSGTSKIWLDHIYVRNAAGPSESFGELLEVWGLEAHLWMTQVTLQVLFLIFLVSLAPTIAYFLGCVDLRGLGLPGARMVLLHTSTQNDRKGRSTGNPLSFSQLYRFGTCFPENCSIFLGPLT